MINKKNNIDTLDQVYLKQIYSILSHNSFKIYLKLLTTQSLISIFQKNIKKFFEIFIDINLNREKLYLLDFLVKKNVKFSKILDIDIALIENKIFDVLLALSKICFQLKKLYSINSKIIFEFIKQLIKNFEQTFVLYDITKYFLTSKQNFTKIFDTLPYMDIIKLEIQVNQKSEQSVTKTLLSLSNEDLILNNEDYDDSILLTDYSESNLLSINLVKFLNKILKIKNLQKWNYLNKNKNIKKILNLRNFKQIQQYQNLKFNNVNFYLTKFYTKNLTNYSFLIKEIVSNKQRSCFLLNIYTKILKQKTEKIFRFAKFGQKLRRERNIFIKMQNILMKIFQKIVCIKNNISNHLVLNTTYFIFNLYNLQKHDIVVKKRLMFLKINSFSILLLQKFFQKIKYNLVLVQNNKHKFSLTKRDKNIFDFYSKNELSFEDTNLENLLEIRFNEYLEIQLKTVFFKTTIILLTIIFRKIIKNYFCNLEDLILENSTLLLSKNFNDLNLEFVEDDNNLDLDLENDNHSNLYVENDNNFNLYVETDNNLNLDPEDYIDSTSLLFEQYCLLLEDLFLYCLDEDETLIGQSFIDILRKHYRYLIKLVKKARNNTIIQSTQNILRKEYELTEDELYENELYGDDYESDNKEQNEKDVSNDN